MNTNIYKGRDGWQAKTIIELGSGTNRHGKPCSFILKITTYKTARGIVSNASGFTVVDGFESHAFDLAGRGGGDFSKRVHSFPQRCTEKAVREIHNTALLYQHDLVAQAKAHYGIAEEA